jgi:hypothetical protein
VLEVEEELDFEDEEEDVDEELLDEELDFEDEEEDVDEELDVLPLMVGKV